jgi:hypothetical protein
MKNKGMAGAKTWRTELNPLRRSLKWRRIVIAV